MKLSEKRITLQSKFLSEVKSNRDFDIAFVGLKPGLHEFLYTLETEELESIEKDFDLNEPAATVRVVLDKENSFLKLQFFLNFSYVKTCDRCNKALRFENWDEVDWILKFSNNSEEQQASNEDDNVIFIDKNESVINLYDWLIELLALTIPMQHIHTNPSDLEDCDKKVLELLDQFNPKSDTYKNPIWKDIDKINFN